MDSISTTTTPTSTTARDLVVGGFTLFVLALALQLAFSLPAGFLALSAVLYAVQGALILRYWPGRKPFGWANRATLARSVIVLALIAWAPYLGGQPTPALWTYALLSLGALILDGVDGKVARATGSHSEFGARFDMELDALFILGLCLAVLALDKAGTWVLALGLMRYAFIAASLGFAWLNANLPDSFRRKTVCVWQVVTLMVAVIPIIPPAFASLTLGLALVLLAWSFFVDVRWLYQRRHNHDSAKP